MRIIEELKNSDLFLLFPKEEDFKQIGLISENIQINEDHINLLNLISNIKKIKNNESNVSCSLKELKKYKDDMEDWIYNNLNYPLTSMNIYNEMLNTFMKGEENTINLLVLTFPKQVEKILNYNKNKNLFLNQNQLLQEFVKNLNLENHYHFNEVVKQTYVNEQPKIQNQAQTQEKSQQQFEKQSFQSTKVGAENANYHSNVSRTSAEFQKNKKSESGIELKEISNEIDKTLNEEQKLRLNRYKKDISVILDKLAESNYLNLSEIEKEPIRKQFMHKIATIHSSIMLMNGIDEQTVFKQLTFPTVISVEDEQKLKILVDVWKNAVAEKIIVNENLLDFNFWKNINQLNENLERKDLILNTFIPQNVKMEEFSKEKNFELVFNTLAMITKDKDKFKERLKFFEKLGYSITSDSVLAFSYKEKNDKGFTRILAKSTPSYSIKFNDKNKYEITSIANLLLKENNPMWNEEINEIQDKLKTQRERRRTL